MAGDGDHRAQPAGAARGTRDWIELFDAPLPVAEALSWVVRPDCGAVGMFCGTVRDHSEGRPGVVHLEYEAYRGQAEAKLALVAAGARERWPVIGRIALLHRVGKLSVGEVSVVVMVSTPHRRDALAAAPWCIDTLKVTAPIWKRETWSNGSDWGLCAHDVTVVDRASPPPTR